MRKSLLSLVVLVATMASAIAQESLTASIESWCDPLKQVVAHALSP